MGRDLFRKEKWIHIDPGYVSDIFLPVPLVGGNTRIFLKMNNLRICPDCKNERMVEKRLVFGVLKLEGYSLAPQNLNRNELKMRMQYYVETVSLLKL